MNRNGRGREGTGGTEDKRKKQALTKAKGGASGNGGQVRPWPLRDMNPGEGVALITFNIVCFEGNFARVTQAGKTQLS